MLFIEDFLPGLAAVLESRYILPTPMAKVKRKVEPMRRLSDLISIGPAMLRDFDRLGVRSVPQLARQNPRVLYEKLCRVTGERQDPCVLDVFCAAVAQAKNPRLPAEKCQWWYWSRQRKRRESAGRKAARKI